MRIEFIVSDEPEPSNSVSGFEEKFPTKQTIYFGLSKFGWVMAAGVGGFKVYFYQIKLGLGWEYISLAFMIFAIWNAINDPLFGIMSDRTQHKLGRRIPYIRYGAPFLAISFIMLYASFIPGTNQIGLFLYLLLTLFLYDTFFTLVVIVNISLLGELALTAKNRTKISFISGVISGIGSAIAAIVPPMLLYNDQPLQRPIDPFQIFVIITGIICFLTLFIMSYYLKEKLMFSRDKPLGFFDSIKYTLKSRAFIILEVIIFIGVFLSTFVGTGVAYYIDYVLDLKGFNASIPIIIYMLGNLLGSFVFAVLAGKYGMRKSLMFSIPLLSGGLLLAFFPTNLWEVILPILLIGFAISAFLIYLDPFIVDIADQDELRTGTRREASFFGVNALITKPAESVAVWALTGMLVAVFAFVEPIIVDGSAIPQPQPANALFGIRFLMSVVPALVLVLLLIAVYFYPLDGPKYREMKLKVRKLHKKKEKRFLEGVAEGEVLDQET